MRTLAAFAVLLAASVAHAQQDEDLSAAHIRLYKKVAPAVVYVQSGNQTGSGVIIDKSGIIVTSPTACGTNTDTVTVTTKGHRQHKGKVIGRVNEKELVVIKIEGGDFPFVELGDSENVKLGQTSYVLGDSFGSIISDDVPAMSLGVISGVYEVSQEKFRGAAYKGVVLETSAAVNPNQDGGPLVDRHGKLLGIVTLNYDESKFTGIAVPIHVLKKDIERIRKEFETGVTVKPTEPAKPGGGWMGVELEEGEDGLHVAKVHNKGPAATGGLQKGDVIKTANGKKVLTLKTYSEILTPLKPGESVKLKVTRAGKDKDLTITLGKKPMY